MDGTSTQETFAVVIDFLTEEIRRSIAEELASCPGLSPGELDALLQATHKALLENAERKLNRLLLLELHAANLGGQLSALDEAGKFHQFLELATRVEFLDALRLRYPPLQARLDRALRQQGHAIVSMARRIAGDREPLSTFLGRPLGDLAAVHLGQGDVHSGGHTVARLEFSGGQVMYKPRSLRIDTALEKFLETVLRGLPTPIRIPSALDCGEYGWAEFIEHKHCKTPAELTTFYKNIGHWLAVMRLLGGTDIHHENLIACGPQPFVVDVESLFVPEPAAKPSGSGEAVDLAEAMIRSSVLRTGLVPFRAPLLGLDGVDISAIGALQGEQPKIRIPEIIHHGTTKARVGLVSIDLEMAKNHPCGNPDISRFWDDIVSGFQDLTGRFMQQHRDGALGNAFAEFRGCRIRHIRRPTQTYVEIMRMLWHPASLHDEAAAIERARDLLARNAEVATVAPSEPKLISAEIEDMRYGDIPVFSNVLDQAQLDEVFRSWRGMRVDLEELTIRGALVTAHLNTRLNDDKRSVYDLTPHHPNADNIDVRRRVMAARTLRQLLQLSVRGKDGTMTWISPILGRSGWAMRTLQTNLYVGLCGISIALAGYVNEMQAGRADEVEGVADALTGVLKVLTVAEDAAPADAVGGFIGLGSQILTWLTLDSLQPDSGFDEIAVRRARNMEQWDFDNERILDVLEGVAGASVALLQLAEVSGDPRWLDLAARTGKRLEDAAIVDDRGARWPASIFNEPIGGFAHGSTGIGWALTRLGLSSAGAATDRERWLALGERAFDFEESLYDQDAENWIDVRKPLSRDFPNTWCHGSVGIGLAACDLYTRTHQKRHLSTLKRAVLAARRGGWGYSHTLCHGDLSSWELLMRARKIDPDLVPEEKMPGIAVILSSIEEHGIVGGLARDAFTPGLMSGISGSIHQLNRMHPACTLPSPLLMECRVGEYLRNKAFEIELVDC